MQITRQATDDTVLRELGERIARTRLELNLTQAQVAAEAGIGTATLERLEAGSSARLDTFVRVLRVLGLLEGLDRAVPEAVPSPIERLKLAGKPRQRARRPRTAEERPSADEFLWGDEIEDREA